MAGRQQLRTRSYPGASTALLMGILGTGSGAGSVMAMCNKVSSQLRAPMPALRVKRSRARSA